MFVSLLRYRGILICNIAPSLRLLVPSSPQVRRQSAHISHYHIRCKVALDLVDHAVDPSDALATLLFLAGHYGRTRSPSVTPGESIRRFWRASTCLLVSCPLLRAARSLSFGAAAATIRTLRQVTRRWHSASLPSSLRDSVVASAFRSGAVSSSATFAFNSSIYLSKAATLASSRRFSSDWCVRQGGVHADFVVCLLASPLPPVAHSLLQSLLSTASLAGPLGHPLQR
jgi:hypothetical protein